MMAICPTLDASYVRPLMQQLTRSLYRKVYPVLLVGASFYLTHISQITPWLFVASRIALVAYNHSVYQETRIAYKQQADTYLASQFSKHVQLRYSYHVS